MEPKNSTIIDLSNASGISDLVAKISSVLDSNEYTNKNLFLKIGKVSLKQSQLLSIKALIEAMNSKLDGIQTDSEMTEASAISLGISTMAPVQNSMPTFQEAFKSVSKSESQFEQEKDSDFNSFAQLKKANTIGDFVTDTSAIPEVEEIKEDETLEEETREFLQEAELEDEETPQEYPEEDTENAEEEQEETAEEDDDNIYAKLVSEQEISAPKDVQTALDITFGEKFYTNTSLYEEEKQEETKNYETTEVIKTDEEAKYILLDTEGITPEGVELIKANTSDLPTLYLTQTLRSGQTVSYEGNIFIIGDVHPGSEVNATGDVTVWGILGGIVHAGSEGNTEAKVRALKLNPIQLRIANLYSRRNDTVNVPYVQRTNEFTPEEARIDKNQIVIYKTLRRED